MGSSKTQDKVCVIIPAYNEGSVIEHVVRQILNALSKTKYTYEVLVVDDGSEDNTAVAAQAGGATVVSHLLNQGAGGATSTGLRYAEKYGFAMAATMDADGQHSPEDVLHCIQKAKESRSDLLIGSRLINTVGMSKVKIIGNQGLSFITRILFGVKVTDSQSGLRVFSKRALDTLEWKSTSYDFCSEMLWRAKQSELDIREEPIKAIYTEYSISKGQNNWNAINIIKSLARRRIVEFFE